MVAASKSRSHRLLQLIKSDGVAPSSTAAAAKQIFMSFHKDILGLVILDLYAIKSFFREIF